MDRTGIALFFGKSNFFTAEKLCKMLLLNILYSYIR